jgi:hypothetical protein
MGRQTRQRYKEGFVNGARKTRDELSEIIDRKDAEIASLRAALAEIANHEVALRYDVATTVQLIAERALAEF